jgi:hypothetical protein
MEDVLEVYKRPSDARRPQVCLDEGGKQLVKELRESLPMQPGQPERVDYEYESIGYGNVFLACEPLAGQRVVTVTSRRTKNDGAYFVRDLREKQYPKAEQLVLVMENLNTHSPASFSEAFPPEEAWQLSQRLEIHYTPKHGSWLNVAEIEWSVLARQVLSRRIASAQEVQQRVDAWLEKRNQQQVGVDWRFPTADARIKLKHLYPSNVA